MFKIYPGRFNYAAVPGAQSQGITTPRTPSPAATKTSADMVLNWEKKQLPVKIEFAVDDIVMANANEELKGPVGFNWQGYAGAAN